MKELVVDKFTFEVFDKVEYIDTETLLIKESVYMNEYSSIESGCNTKHSILLQDFFFKKRNVNLYLIFNNIRYAFNRITNQNIRPTLQRCIIKFSHSCSIE